MRTILLATLALIITSCSSTSVAEEEQLFNEEGSENLVVQLTNQEQQLFDLINDHRISIGLDALEFSAESYEFALDHNQYMIAQGELSHDNFNARASSIAKITSANFVAENVAKDYMSVEDAMAGWLESNPHKTTIEGDFTHSTLSISYDAEGNPYYTQIFFRK